MIDSDQIKRQYTGLFTNACAIQIDDGWCWLFSGLCRSLLLYNQETFTDDPVLIHAATHSLGGISVGYYGGDAHTESMISAAELLSHQVCQLCGSTSDVGGTFGPIIITLCRKCWTSDERYHVHYLSPNLLTKLSIDKILKGLMYLPDDWYKKRWQQIVV